MQWSEPRASRPWSPAVDIFETEDAVTLKADLPDVKTDEIDIRVENGIQYGDLIQYDDFDYMAHAKRLTGQGLLADAHAAAARLRERSADPVFTAGFCMFGGQSWRLAATDLHPAGAIGFYGRPSSVEDVIGDIDSPLLILAAGDDKATSQQENANFVAALSEAGKAHDYVLYEGAPHSFFDRGFEQWQDECSDSWLQILAFIDRNR